MAKETTWDPKFAPSYTPEEMLKLGIKDKSCLTPSLKQRFKSLSSYCPSAHFDKRS